MFGCAPGKINFVKMNNTKNGGSVNSPPVLDDTNYDYWTEKIIAFLKIH
jgi:hypothetical protein